MAEGREADIILVWGRQGAGKTYRQIEELKVHIMDDARIGRRGRRVLVFDCNVRSGSYKDFQTINYNCGQGLRPEQKAAVIKTWNPDTSRAEIRRVINYRPDGTMMDMDEMNDTAIVLMSQFERGLLVLEDTNIYLYGAAQKRFYSEFVRVRHKVVDLVMIIQGPNVVDQRMWTNVSMVRMHKALTSVDATSLKKKHKDKYMPLKIAELIIDEQYDKGNKYFFLYVNLRDNKIIGVTNEATIDRAVRRYITLNSTELYTFMALNDMDRGKKDQLEKAKVMMAKSIVKDIWQQKKTKTA